MIDTTEDAGKLFALAIIQVEPIKSETGSEHRQDWIRLCLSIQRYLTTYNVEEVSYYLEELLK